MVGGFRIYAGVTQVTRYEVKVETGATGELFYSRCDSLTIGDVLAAAGRVADLASAPARDRHDAVNVAVRVL